MADIEYQKIELHTTEELVKEQEIIEYEKETVQKLMIDNQIQFTMEIDQKEEKAPTGNSIVVYVLNLIVRKDDVDKVIELLDKEGDLGYYVDLDDTYNPMEEAEEQEELKEEVEDDPIKVYGEDDGRITVEFKTPESKDIIKIIMKLISISPILLIYIVQIGLMIYVWDSHDYETITSIIVLMIIETPIFIWLYNFFKSLNKK